MKNIEQYDHTPAEWAHEYCGKDRIKIFKISDKRRIATVEVKSHLMDEANARLISSAPALLAALKNLLDYTDALDAYYTSKGMGSNELGANASSVSISGRARAAIAKAEGGDK